MAMNKLRYNFAGPDEVDNGCEKSYVTKLTLDRGINASGIVHWEVPANMEAFTDLSETYMSVELHVTRGDGSRLGDEDRVFLNTGGLHNLFSTCTISLNGTALPVNTHYAQATTLLSYISTTYQSRRSVWDPLCGWGTHLQMQSHVASPTPSTYDNEIAKLAKSRRLKMYGRLASDFTMSCAQFLPPGVRVDVRLTRQPVAFSLVDGAGGDYQLHIDSASLFVKRVVLRESVRKAALERFSGGGGQLRYNRLSTVLQPIPERSLIFRWNNVYNSGALPQTLYLVLLAQKGYYGELSQLSNYFESAGVGRVSFALNGRAVLAEAYTASFVYNGDEGSAGSVDLVESEALSPFLGLVSRVGSVRDPSHPLGFGYTEFLAGSTMYVAQLETCGGQRMEGGGALDVELTFAAPTSLPFLCMIFGELHSTVSLDRHLNVLHTA